MDNLANGVAASANTCIAYANVQRLATKCTIANMQALLDSQVAIPSLVANAERNAIITSSMARPMRARELAPHFSPPMSSTVIAIPR